MTDSEKALRPVYEDEERGLNQESGLDSEPARLDSPETGSRKDRQQQAQASLKWLGLLTVLLIAGLAGFASSQNWFGFLEPAESASANTEEAPISRTTIAETYASRDLRYRELPPLGPLGPRSGKEVIEECLQVANHLANWLERNPDAQEMRARAEFEFGDPETAKQIWQSLLEKNPDYAYALKGLGDIALLDGDLPTAISYFEKNYIAQPTIPAHKFAFASALSTAGEYEKAAELLRELVEAFPTDDVAFLELGAAYRQLQEWESAEEALEKALDLNDELIQAYQALAQVKAKLGKRDEAKELQSQFRERSSRPQSTELESGYDDLAALQIDVANLYTDMAKVYIGAGGVPSGKLLLLRAQRMSPQSVEPYQALAWLARNEDRYLDAIRWLTGLSKLDSAEFSYTNEIANLYLTTKRPQDALKTLEEFFENNPDHLEGLLALSNLNLELGKSDQALQLARRAIDTEPGLTSFTWMATVAEQCGDTSQAIEALKQAIDLAPDAEQLKLRLEQLSHADSDASQDSAARKEPNKDSDDP